MVIIFFIDSYGNILEEEPEQQTSEFNNYTFNTSINISNLNLSQEAPCFIILENNNNELIPIVIGLDNNDLVIECMISEDLEYKGSYPDAEWKSLTYDASLEEMVDNVISEPPTISNVKILSYSEILENQNALNILTNDLLLHYFSSIN